jgi:putative PIN family toxin of toxin-antitoxin system
LGISRAFALLIPEPLLAELTRRVNGKPYLSARISQEALEQFFAILLSVGEVIPSFDDPIPSISRDEKDDYVVAYARIADADYLVTGDKDLLVLRGLFDRPAIRTPAECVRAPGLDVSDEPEQEDSVEPGEPENEAI